METSKNFPSVETPDEGYQKTFKNCDELLPTLPESKGWWVDQLFQYQGFWILSFGIRGSILINDHFKPRPTDIIVATSPKCRTTWLRALVFSIINRHSFDFSDHPLHKANSRELVPFFEAFIQKGGSTSFVDGIPSPRLLSTHLPYSLFPTRMTDDTSACRFVYICRDPKDVFVSKWHFAKKLRPKELPPLSLEETFDLFCKGVSDRFGITYWGTGKLVWSHRRRKVAEFLGVPFTPEEENKETVEQIVKLCSFESMSNQDVNKLDKRYQQSPISNSDFFRKGEVGDWVNHLSPQMAEKLDQITEQKLQDTGFNFH
ncbi:hypothetical protein PVK06_005834 [Gossypium arboreum]|uniref:Sulfotransferase n=1 Tax=Gossypium arboreum TaxID=29729 RepID=A0ABR0QWM8_GOSAR|nr:hypothetical protein PVK06_005834 [Gossypium arboreum]